MAPASGGRGNKGVAQQVAEKAGISKRAVRKRIRVAEAAIGEKIDLDRDSPEELERKAAKRRQAEPKVERPKRRKPVQPDGIENPKQPARPQAAEIGSQIDGLWKVFAAIGRKYQLRFIHDACLRLGLNPLKMAPPAAFGLAEEAPQLAVDLPAEVPPATGDAAVASQAEQRDDVADPGTEGLPNTGDDPSEAADQEPGGAMKCAYCSMDIESGDRWKMIHGQPYHGDLCVKYAKPIAIAAE